MSKLLDSIKEEEKETDIARALRFYRALESMHILKAKERALIVEYHFFKTPTSQLAEEFRLSRGRIYKLIRRAERKLHVYFTSQ
ncbi:MAG TPA: sigma factor-like helix-turn-helix DNA-binding protein [Patescibacteria group bacterium]|nr:sigma factor-like helix-turn-helix DNA-binding protein [Patescibacteria group bacterium]